MDKAKFLSKTARRFQTIRLPDGDEVMIRSLTGGEMRLFRESLVDKRGELIKRRGDMLNELLLVRCLVGDDKQPFLTDAEAMDGALDEMDGAVVLTVAEACKSWTGFKTDGDFSAIEDAIKNSEDDRESNGYTASPPVSVVTT